jgi:hypothetical protein
MKTMKLSACLALIVGILFLLTWGGRVARSVENENQCIACHTSAKSLISITRDIAKLQKDKPGSSPETSGEG